MVESVAHYDNLDVADVGTQLASRSPNLTKKEKTIFFFFSPSSHNCAWLLVPHAASTAQTWRDVDAIGLEMCTDIDGCIVVPLCKIVSIKFTRSGFAIDAIQGAQLSKYAFHSSLLSNSFKAWCAARSLHTKASKNVFHNFSIDPTDTLKLSRPADKTRTASARVSIASTRVQAKNALDDEHVLLALSETSTFATTVKKALPPTPQRANATGPTPRSSQVSDDEAGAGPADDPFDDLFFTSSHGSSTTPLQSSAPEPIAPADAAAPSEPVDVPALPALPTQAAELADEAPPTPVVVQFEANSPRSVSPRGASPPDSWIVETPSTATASLFRGSPRRPGSPPATTNYSTMPSSPLVSSVSSASSTSGTVSRASSVAHSPPSTSNYASAFPLLNKNGGTVQSAANNGYAIVAFDPNAKAESGVVAGSFATVDFAAMHRANSRTHAASPTTNYAEMPARAPLGGASAAAAAAPASPVKGVYESDTLLRLRQDDVSLLCPSCGTTLSGALADQRKHIADCAVAVALAKHEQTQRLRAAALTAAPKSTIEYPFSCGVCGNSYQYECDLQLHASKRHGIAAPPVAASPLSPRTLARNVTTPNFQTKR